MIWCHFFWSLILAPYNDYITSCFNFVIPFGFIFLLYLFNYSLALDMVLYTHIRSSIIHLLEEYTINAGATLSARKRHYHWMLLGNATSLLPILSSGIMKAWLRQPFIIPLDEEITSTRFPAKYCNIELNLLYFNATITNYRPTLMLLVVMSGDFNQVCYYNRRSFN